MKKRVILIGSIVLCAALCAFAAFAIFGEDGSKYPECDAYLEKKAQNPSLYLEKDYAKYVLSQVSFEAIPYTVSEEEYAYEPNVENRAMYWLSHCKAFEMNIPLADALACRSFMWLLWHSMGQIGFEQEVPEEIVYYKEQDVVAFVFDNYNVSYNRSNGLNIESCGVVILVDAQTGELLQVTKR